MFRYTHTQSLYLHAPNNTKRKAPWRLPLNNAHWKKTVVFSNATKTVIESGSLMFAEAAEMELARLAIPRRVYTQSHIDYVVEAPGPTATTKYCAGTLPIFLMPCS